MRVKYQKNTLYFTFCNPAVVFKVQTFDARAVKISLWTK